jgi:hypothetical protein
MDEARLPTASCVYELRPGPPFGEVIETLGSLVTQTDRPKQRHDLRVGVIFKGGDQALRMLYFEDRAGLYDIEGFSGDRELIAKADLPERLRAIALHPDVTLLNDRPGQCPRA